MFYFNCPYFIFLIINEKNYYFLRFLERSLKLTISDTQYLLHSIFWISQYPDHILNQNSFKLKIHITVPCFIYFPRQFWSIVELQLNTDDNFKYILQSQTSCKWHWNSRLMRIDATKHYRLFDKNSMIFKPYLKFQKLELSRTTRSYLKTFSLVLPTCVTFRGQHLNIKIDNSCFSEYSISHCQEISKTNSSLKE